MPNAPHVPLLTSPLLTKHSFRHGFSTRQGGVSRAPFDSLNLSVSVGDEPNHVAENQRRFAAAVGYEADRLFMLSQVHGRSVRVVTANDPPERVRVEQGDGLVAAAGLAVGVRSADCVPVLLVDPETRYVAAVHAGWRGVLAEVVPAALDVLCASAGVPASRVCAAVFPHIRRCHFQVDSALAQQLAAANRGREPCVFQQVAGSAEARRPERSGEEHAVIERAAAAASGPQLSAASPGAELTSPQLVAAVARGEKVLVALDVIVRAQLAAHGVLAANIDDVPGCTVCDRERFYSYRRDGAGRTGQHLTAVVG